MSGCVFFDSHFVDEIAPVLIGSAGIVLAGWEIFGIPEWAVGKSKHSS